MPDSSQLRTRCSHPIHSAAEYIRQPSLPHLAQGVSRRITRKARYTADRQYVERPAMSVLSERGIPSV